MFGMLRLAMTLLIVILAVGWYLGWFAFKQAPVDPQSDTMNVNVSVDKKKMGTDLQNFEQNVAKRIQDIKTQPQGNNPAPPSGRQPVAPRLNFGPISVQPSNPPVGQPASPPWSVGPFSAGPSNQPGGPAADQPAAQPQIRLQTQDYQFTVPLGAPPAGEGR